MKSFLKKIFFIERTAFHYIIRLLGIKFSVSASFRPNPDLYKYEIKSDKILFHSFSGTYNCNPKYICEEIRKRKLPYELVLIVKDKNKIDKSIIPADIKIVSEYSDEALHAYATSKVWVDSIRKSMHIYKSGITKKKGQTYIQTWHGALGIKKTSTDRNNASAYIKYDKIDAKMIDYILSNGKYTTNFCKNVFWADDSKIIETGLPRNDIFFTDSTDIKNNIYRKYNIQDYKKIVMYAPTFREDYDLSCYDLDFEKLKNALTSKFGGEWVVFVKLHPIIADLKNLYLSKYEGVVDVTDYPDMQELLVSADVVITDYSSCIYDYILSNKIGFIYATDVEKYDNTRGLYYSLKETPFLIATNNNEMVENIKNFDNEVYLKKVNEFLKGKGCIDDGKASERVVDLIESIVNN